MVCCVPQQRGQEKDWEAAEISNGTLLNIASGKKKKYFDSPDQSGQIKQC